MRQVLSISLPANKLKSIKEKAQKRGFDSVSGYVNYLFREDEDLMSEEQLLGAIREAQKEYKTGKLKKLNSLMDLA